MMIVHVEVCVDSSKQFVRVALNTEHYLFWLLMIHFATNAIHFDSMRVCIHFAVYSPNSHPTSLCLLIYN